MDKRFEQVDNRFDQMDKRFEQVDNRFEKVENRLDRIESRLDKVEKNTTFLYTEVGRNSLKINSLLLMVKINSKKKHVNSI
ncbi:hypothetical protein [Aquibacillus albus]|uniref:Archaellum component FlaC n=1 Tax=Aquibacillus albus TaxID=1168171 RepID=A0ABS2MW05_9BACI|nr:hypothetical protein [Aquibacillus albus]MBM7570062.1 archaellum component FlaC [Aquibacillus albus]